MTLHVVHPQVGLIFTLVARFNQLGGQLLHPVLERRGKPTNPFQKFPPSDLTPQCRQLAGSARGCQRVSVLQECFRKNSLRRADHLALVVSGYSWRFLVAIVPE